MASLRHCILLAGVTSEALVDLSSMTINSFLLRSFHIILVRSGRRLSIPPTDTLMNKTKMNYLFRLANLHLFIYNLNVKI